jgi:hypothetical protein
MTSDEPRIAEQDGNVVRIVAGKVEVIAAMTRGPHEIIFDRLSIDGAGPGSLGLARLRELARQFARSQGVGNSHRRNDANDGSESREDPARDHYEGIIKIMYVVALLGWSEGFVANRLVDLLRRHGHSLADAFRLSAQLADGTQVAIPFASLEEADRFAREARQLHARLEIRLPAGAAG